MVINPINTQEWDKSLYTVPWRTIPSAIYSATPLTSNTISISDSNFFAQGDPIRYSIGAQLYYGQITAVTSNVVTICGAPLTGAIEKLELGTQSLVNGQQIVIYGNYGLDVGPLVSSINGSLITHSRGDAYLVSVGLADRVSDSTQEPLINLKVGGDYVLNAGMAPGDLDSPVYSVVNIDTNEYQMQFRALIEIDCVQAADTGDAEDLTVILTYVSAR